MPESTFASRRALALVDLGAVERNCAHLKRLLGGSLLCAVVKADGYGHGAAECARAALAGGAGWLAVATAGEAAGLRAEAIDARILVMGALESADLDMAIDADADVVCWTREFLQALSKRSADGRSLRAHVKLDTGMGRLGTRDVRAAIELVDALAGTAGLEAVGFMTHFATADEPDTEFLEHQLNCFAPAAAAAKRSHPQIVIHAANSAATVTEPRTHFDMARCGIAIYGLDPLGDDPVERRLEPALRLESYVADVKHLGAGDSAGYGRTWTSTGPTSLGVLPIGYGDGYRRGLSNRADVLIRGRRHPVVGNVSMDNITVDVGTDTEVRPGDTAILIGSDRGERILAEDLARSLGTINYEVTCGLSARVPRIHRRR